MSRIGRQPIPLPTGVSVTIEPELVTVQGPQGRALGADPARHHRRAEPTDDGDGQQLVVTRPTDRGEHRALHGLTRTLVANMVTGVTAGFEKRLEIQGVGYRAQLKGRDLELALGYSTRSRSRRPRGSSSRCHSRHGSLSAAPPSSRSERSPPTSASSASLSRTRARASATRASSSPRRLVSEHERQDQGSSPSEAAPSCPRQGPRHGRAPADLGVPIQSRDLRAADRRRSPGTRLPPSIGRRRRCASSRPTDQAKQAGALLAERAKAAGVESAVFDRGGYQYHGRVQALADGAREGGLLF